MDYNYHTHTSRCRHASGTIEEYILRAIECGVKYMGFSDHFPYICTNGEEAGFRVPVSEAYEYVAEVNALRDKYKDKIDIKIGFEMEYYPDNFETMLKNAQSYGADYLILGPHFIKEEFPDGEHTITPCDDEAVLKNYAETIANGIKTGAFTYVAHPDMFNFTGDKSVYCEHIRKIAIASRECNIPLEINFLGIRDNRIYPNELFWKIAGEEKAPATFGFDSHDVQNAYDGASYPKAMELVKKYNINYIGKPQIIDINKLQ